eukprot:g2744.t1
MQTLLAENSDGSLVKLRLTLTGLGLFVLSLAGYVANRLMHSTSTLNKTQPTSNFFPEHGVAGVVARGGPPGALQLLAPSLLSTACLFTYASQDAPLRNDHSEEAWLYGAKIDGHSNVAQISGIAADVLRGKLNCWKGSQFAEQVRRAERSLRDAGKVLQRGQVTVVKRDGSLAQAQWFYQANTGGSGNNAPPPILGEQVATGTRLAGQQGATAVASMPQAAEAAPKRNLCLFDLDETLLPLDSDHAWCQFMVTLGWVEPVSFAAKSDEFFAQYKAKRLDVHGYIAFQTEPFRDRSAEELAVAHQRFMQEIILPVITPSARALVQKHVELGDAIAVVTATNEFVTRPIALAFGLDQLIAINLAKGPDGKYTGEIDGVPTYQQGKVTRVKEWLVERGWDWDSFERISVYSDSANDLPLMEMATDPVATNPSPELAMIAKERGWPILDLYS